jgi:hypothetical protein
MDAHRHPAAAPAVLLGCAALVAGCGGGDDVEPPSGVDQARLIAVQTDPALAGGTTKAASVETGSSASPYFRAQVVRDGGGTPAQLVAAARSAGWRVTSVACVDPAAAGSGPAVSVQAFRTMPDPMAGGGSYTVGLRIEDNRAIAVVPYHLDEANPWGAPDIDIAPRQSCAETPGAPASAGQPVEISTAAAPAS